MTNEKVENFINKKFLDQLPVKVNFKNRGPIHGIFIKTSDYADLKAKNLWRIVGENNLAAYNKSKDSSLAGIFSGVHMKKIEASKEG